MAADAIRVTRRIAAARALARFEPEEFRPGPAAQSEAELVHAAGDIGTTIFHPVGTCRMGHGGDAQAVVDDQLRVRGIDSVAGGRRLDHADAHLGQHQRAGDHDRREGGRSDPGRPPQPAGGLKDRCQAVADAPKSREFMVMTCCWRILAGG